MKQLSSKLRCRRPMDVREPVRVGHKKHLEGCASCFISSGWPVVTAWLGFTLVGPWAFRTCGTSLGGLSTCSNAYRHLLNFTRPDLQPHVRGARMPLPLEPCA